MISTRPTSSRQEIFLPKWKCLLTKDWLVVASFQTNTFWCRFNQKMSHKLGLWVTN